MDHEGVRKVGAVTSTERGSPVTMASGNSILPMFVFPRKNYRNYIIAN
jgi:hypothetical protein